MKKLETLLLCLALSLAWTGCGDDNDDPQDSQQEQKPGDEQKPSDEQKPGDEQTPAVGQACTAPAVDGRKIYDCDDQTKKYVLYDECVEGMLGLVYEEEGDYVALCYQPCKADQVDKKAKACAEGMFGSLMAGDLACTKLVEGVYGYDITDLNDFENIDICEAGCINGACEKLADDEGKTCGSDFVERCDGNVLVFCDGDSKTVRTSKCDKYEDENYVCKVAKDGSGADCVENVPCSVAGKKTAICDDVWSELSVFICEAATDGKNYNYYSYDESIDCESCNAEKGICED